MGPVIDGLIDVLRNSGQGSGRFRPIFEALQESLQEAKGFKQRSQPGLVHWPRRWKMSKNMEQIQAHIEKLVSSAHNAGVIVNAERLSQVAADQDTMEAVLHEIKGDVRDGFERMQNAIQQERSDLAAEVLDGSHEELV